MSAPLDLTRSAHTKIMVSPPRLNLRRAASYQGIANEKLPVSATSSSFNFNHLLFSPPPSPGLPVLITRPRKPSNAPRPSRVFRVLGYVIGLVVLLYVSRLLVKKNGHVPLVDWDLGRSGNYEMVGQYDLPDFPTPIAVTDRRGRSKWTVSIPPTSDFPLTAKEYSEICAKCQEVAAHVRELRGESSEQARQSYYHEDPHFLDVHEAERGGLLPGARDKTWHVGAQTQEGHLVGDNKDNLIEKPVCKTSLTFVLESPEAGLGPTLMMLFMAYGLAQKEGRAFFIDDSRWAYGGYTGIFKPPPVQACNPPPRHEMLPCPHHARHLVVSVATARDTFGQSFDDEYETIGRHDNDREKPMFDLARTGYEALFHLIDEDEAYVRTRTQELKTKAKVPQGNFNDGTVIGVHVRHGDQHPFEFQYSATYMPLTSYMETIRQVIDDLHNNSMPDGSDDVVAKQHSLTVLASDDPDVYEAEEFSGHLRAQERIKLASVSHTKEDSGDPHVMHKFVEETFGWEGGFFASMFWNLGRGANNNADAPDPAQVPLSPSTETTRLRSLIGRAYMMDLAVLGQASDVVICTISAAGCRLAAVIMGWEEAIENGNWMNIDGNYQWMGVPLD